MYIFEYHFFFVFIKISTLFDDKMSNRKVQLA